MVSKRGNIRPRVSSLSYRFIYSELQSRTSGEVRNGTQFSSFLKQYQKWVLLYWPSSLVPNEFSRPPMSPLVLSEFPRFQWVPSFPMSSLACNEFLRPIWVFWSPMSSLVPNEFPRPHWLPSSLREFPGPHPPCPSTSSPNTKSGKKLSFFLLFRDGSYQRLYSPSSC